MDGGPVDRRVNGWMTMWTHTVEYYAFLFPEFTVHRPPLFSTLLGLLSCLNLELMTF